MTDQATGILLMIFAVWATIFQFTFFKPLISKTSLKQANALGCLLMALATMILPLGSYAVQVRSSVCLLVCLFVCFGFSFSFCWFL